MGAAKQDIVIEQGSKYDPIFQWVDEDDQPINIDGWTGKMQIRDGKSKTSTLIHEASTANGKMTINGIKGEVRPIITATESDTFSFNWAWYDIEITPPTGAADTERLAQGKVRLDKSVTD